MRKYAIYQPGNVSTARLCAFVGEREQRSVVDDDALSRFWWPIGRDDARHKFPAAFRRKTETVEAGTYDTFEDLLTERDGENLWVSSPDGTMSCWTGYPR